MSLFSKFLFSLAVLFFPGAYIVAWAPPINLPLNNNTARIIVFAPAGIDGSGNGIAVYSTAQLRVPLPETLLGPLLPFNSNSWQLSTLPVNDANAFFTPIRLAVSQPAPLPQPQPPAQGTRAVAIWVEQNNFAPPTRRTTLQGAIIPNNSNQWTQTSEIAPSVVADDIALAIDPSGNAIAIWEPTTQGNEVQLMASMLSSESTTWTTTQIATVPIVAGTNFISPKIAIDADGNAYVIWNALGRLQSATLLSGQSQWNVQTNIATVPGSINALEIAANKPGAAIAVFSSFSVPANSNTLRSLTFSNNQWSDPIVIGEGSSPSIDIDNNGNAVAAWEIASLIRTASLPFNASEWSESNLISYTNTDSENPRVKVDNDGDAVVAWDSRVLPLPAPPITYGVTHPFGSDWNSRVRSLKRDGILLSLAIQKFTGNALVVSRILGGPGGNFQTQSTSGFNLFTTTPDPAVAPPRNVKGKNQKNQFLTQTEKFFQITWSPSPDAFEYHIFLDDILVGLLPADVLEIDFPFTEEQLIYTITAVDEEGFSSPPVRVKTR